MPDSKQILFSEMQLSPVLAKAIEDLQYPNATAIQAQAIPLLLAGRDVIGHSSTGSGKTAAFGIPAVELIDTSKKYPQVLVLSPTRELAMQISGEMEKYAKYKEGVSIACVYGGASMPDQIRQLRSAHIVIGTPGRLMDHLRRNSLQMQKLKMVVLDESDEMLSMGFIDDIKEILSHAPEQRQTVLFSATMPAAILDISKQFLNQPHVVDVLGNNISEAKIEQTFYYVPSNQKQDAIALLLRANDSRHTMIFCNTKSMVDELTEKLVAMGFKAIGLHGDMTQPVRSQVMERFRTGAVQILVATDVAARGIDVNDIAAVINYDLPQRFDYYVHRIGRTGRAGKTGVSQTLICNGQQLGMLRSLMRFTGIEIVEHRLPSGADIRAAYIERLAERLLQSEEKPTKAAQKLVEHLLKVYDAEEASLVLADALLEGSPAFMPTPEVKQRKIVASARTSHVTVTANVGRNNKTTPNHLISALVEHVNISPKEIGKIDIKPACSHIQLTEGAARALQSYPKSMRILGVKVKFVFPKPRTEKNQPKPEKKPAKSTHR